MKLDVSTVLAQWAAGGLFFCWITTRHRVVGLGYGWLLRIVYGSLAALALVANAASIGPWYLVCTSLMLAATLFALAVSVAHKDAGVSGQTKMKEARKARVAAMTQPAGVPAITGGSPANPATKLRDKEFPPGLDLIAPVFGILAMFGAAAHAGGSYPLALSRLVVGALFLGVITDAMLLGHWYLVQPGLGREPIKELVRDIAVLWPFELVVFLISPGMIQVLNGSISDGYNGLLGWVWLGCAIFTIGLVVVTWLALRERYYSAVMAATGLLYLAILTGFGMDLVARAVLAP